MHKPLMKPINSTIFHALRETPGAYVGLRGRHLNSPGSMTFPLSPITLYGSVQSHQSLSPPPHNATEECLFIRHPASEPDILYTPMHELYIGINPHCWLIIPACLALLNYHFFSFLMWICAVVWRTAFVRASSEGCLANMKLGKIRGLQMTLACVLPCICSLWFTFFLLLTRKLEVN